MVLVPLVSQRDTSMEGGRSLTILPGMLLKNRLKLIFVESKNAVLFFSAS